jgi:hypothetical protein
MAGPHPGGTSSGSELLEPETTGNNSPTSATINASALPFGESLIFTTSHSRAEESH